MYKNNFVVTIKHNGKILRESNDVVNLPFDSEYSIFLKNKNSVKALVTIEVDGKNVLRGNDLIISPNESTEIKGWMRDMDETSRFKFIRKTKQIEKFRGNRIDDGLVRIAYRFEKNFRLTVSRPWENEVFYHYNDDRTGVSWPPSDNVYTMSSCKSCLPSKDEGITIKGKKVNQQYSYGNVGSLETVLHVIVLKLCGTTIAGRKVNKIVTTKSKLQCEVCGKKWKSHITYCGNCGNYLR